MENSSQTKGMGNPILQISLDDLREVVKDLCQEERSRIEEAIKAHREHPVLSRKETAEMLGVTLSTLWQWDRTGYLTPVKIGSKVMYRPQDVEEVLLSKKRVNTREEAQQMATAYCAGKGGAR